MLLFLLMLSTVPLASGEETCTTRPDSSAIASGHALLQTSRVSGHLAPDTSESVVEDKFIDVRTAFFDQQRVYQGAPSCVPPTLLLQKSEYLLQKGSTSHIAFFETFKAPLLDVGETAALDASGFKDTTSACCPMQTEIFFKRLLVSLGYDVCSKPHVQGLMHWFTCVPDMDFQYVLDIIANGNPCKYWAPTGQACPTLSSECEGHFCTSGSGLCCKERPASLLMHRAETDKMKQPISSITQFDCTRYPGAIQILKADGHYAAKNLNIQTGKYELAYTIPFDRTTPNFLKINAASINPIDGIAYTVLAMPGYRSYLVRFDENAVEFVARIATYSIAGSFSSKGTFYYRRSTAAKGPMAIRNVAKMKGEPTPDGKFVAQLQYDQALKAPGLESNPFGNDLVAYVGDLEGAGSEDEYIVSLRGDKLAIFRDAGTKSKYWIIDAKGGAGADFWGAGWNFKGAVYFSSNNGAGVYQVPLAQGIVNDASVLLRKVVAATEATGDNDGMNCMDLDTPFEPPENGCEADFEEVQANADGSCPTGTSRG